MSPLILASASPRRQELLRQIGLPFTVLVTNAVERPWAGEPPAEYALAQARAKADAALASAPPGAAILGADTVVVLGSEVLGKPGDADEARGMLRRLAGRAHEVITAFRVISTAAKEPRHRDRAVITEVVFEPLEDEAIAGYLATGEWEGKAGAYAIQGVAGAFVSRIEGSYPNVVGLPISEVVIVLRELGLLPGFPLGGGGR
jgi:septum formation protein